MAKYIGKAMSISTFKIEQCKLVPTVTVLCTHNYACTNVRAKQFYVHENQCMQISDLSSLANVQHKEQCFWRYWVNSGKAFFTLLTLNYQQARICSLKVTVFWMFSVTLEIFNWKKYGINKQCIPRQIIDNEVWQFFIIGGDFAEFHHNLFPNQRFFFVTVRKIKVFG